MPEHIEVIAVFDFDDTLIDGNSLRDFLASSFPRRRRVRGFVRIAPHYLLFLLRRRSLSQVKGRLLTVFLAGLSERDLTEMCLAYRSRLEELVVPEALARLRWHQDAGHTVVVESASLAAWIRPWAAGHGIDRVIATELRIDEGTVQPGLAGPNCAGPEKVVRFLAEFPDRDRYQLYVYGDGRTDREMLALADHAFLGRFG
jgi:HAD superfamily hydrolase (TIGR01490 family)